MAEAITRYEGTEVDVSWDGRLCIHVGECGRSEGVLFVTGRDPWCRPDEASVDDVAEIVERCPSGALVAIRKKDGAILEEPEEQNSVMVSPHGPLYARGLLEIEGAPPDMPGLRFRAALCRCGESRNKPFCDNSHEGKKFRDRGAVGRAGRDYEGEGGALRITAVPAGPLKLEGRHWVIAATGRPAYRGTESYLCRCGQSSNKPFCDGSHKAAGFTG